jgi:D-amino peptidase
MVQGIGDSVDGVIFIGYHARAGSLNAILDHTWSSSRVANLWLNGLLVGESGLNAAISGHFNASVLMLAGDQTACAQAVELLGPIETAEVKQATSRFSAECLPPPVAHEKITQAAKRAVQRLVDGKAVAPFRLEQPILVTIEFLSSDMADRAVQMPGARRLDGRRIEFSAPDMPAAFAGFRSAVDLA